MPDRDMMVPQPSKREQKREAAEYQKRGATAKKPKMERMAKKMKPSREKMLKPMSDKMARTKKKR